VTKRTITLAGIALSILLLVYPFDVLVAPEWNVKVVDENGKALAGAYVEELASHETLDFQHNEAVCTNVTGEAKFVRRTVRASVLTRVSKRVSRFNVHGGLGPYVAVGIDRLGYGDMPAQNTMPNFNGLAWYGSPSRMDSLVVLHGAQRDSQDTGAASITKIFSQSMARLGKLPRVNPLIDSLSFFSELCWSRVPVGSK